MEQRAVQVMSEWVIAYDRWQDQGMAWPGSSEVGGYWSAKEKDMLLVIFKTWQHPCDSKVWWSHEFAARVVPYMHKRRVPVVWQLGECDRSRSLNSVRPGFRTWICKKRTTTKIHAITAQWLETVFLPLDIAQPPARFRISQKIHLLSLKCGTFL